MPDLSTPDPTTPLTVTPLTVTELTARIKQVLESGFSRIEVCGEISRLTRPASGHLYFTIKDAHAAIAAVIWRSTASRLSIRPEEGGEYHFSGHLSLYEPRGSYQLVVTRIEAAGAGRLAAEFERRKQLFAERGWFNSDNKQQLPPLPRHIGIVTSGTAAAFEDVKKVLATRPGWLQLTLSPCLVQGAQAPASIASAMQRIAAMESPPDLILLVRGGGSIEDLWCFNDEAVVRAIVDSPIPVITGIGHEIDTTLADFAADLRAATPSNAAERAAPSKAELAARLPRRASLMQLLQRKLDGMQRETSARHQRLEFANRRQMDARLHMASRLQARLESAGLRLTRQARMPLQALEQRLKPLQPGQRLALRRRQWIGIGHDLQLLRRELKQRMQQTRQQQQQQLHGLAATLTNTRRRQLELLTGQLRELDPRAVLKRGYTLSMDAEGRPVSSSRQLKTGELLRVQFHDGVVDSRIESIEGENP